MGKRRTAVKGLGEIALRVNNLDKMQEFYEGVIGLEVMALAQQIAILSADTDPEAAIVAPRRFGRLTGRAPLSIDALAFGSCSLCRQSPYRG